MKAEIIAVGTELLMGEIVNTNAAWLSQRLAEMGVDVHYHGTVGDNPERLKRWIRQAAERSELLIFTGGLGPTPDDLTIAMLAETFEERLVSNPTSEAAIRAIFSKRGISMPESNLKQALMPETAEHIQNPVGTAPGLAWDVSKKCGKPTYILAFPGVPNELYVMWEQGKQYIRQWQGDLGESCLILRSKSLHFMDISEAALGELLGDLMAGSNPTVAPYVGQGQIRIRISAKAESDEKAAVLIEPVKHQILERAGKYYLGEGEMPIEARLAEILARKALSLSIAESCTGGLISSRITDVPGSSAFTFINMVTYGNTEKSRFIEVSPETLRLHGAVSPEVAGEMARGIRNQSHCDIGLSITGIAGPKGGSPEKPVGLAYVGICGSGTPCNKEAATDSSAPDLLVKKIVVNPQLPRREIKLLFSQYALFFLLKHLSGELESDFPALSMTR